jgi:hypothetical protein
MSGITPRDMLEISFECSILYRLLLLMGAPYLAVEPLSQGDRAFNAN